jgi:hypothetical protein
MASLRNIAGCIGISGNFSADKDGKATGAAIGMSNPAADTGIAVAHKSAIIWGSSIPRTPRTLGHRRFRSCPPFIRSPE